MKQNFTNNLQREIDYGQNDGPLLSQAAEYNKVSALKDQRIKELEEIVTEANSLINYRHNQVEKTETFDSLLNSYKEKYGK